MASPAVGAVVNSSSASELTEYTLNLPSGITSGQLLVVGFTLRWGTGAGSDPRPVSLPAGWNFFLQAEVTGGPTSVMTHAVWKDATGSEGSTVALTCSLAPGGMAARAWRITGADDPDVRPPESDFVTATDNSDTIDPPSLTPTGGLKDYLWFAFSGAAGSGVTTYPTDYTDTVSVSSSNASFGSCRRALTASSEDPSAFVLSASVTRRIAATVAIHPTSAINLTPDVVAAVLAGAVPAANAGPRLGPGTSIKHGAVIL